MPKIIQYLDGYKADCKDFEKACKTGFCSHMYNCNEECYLVYKYLVKNYIPELEEDLLIAENELDSLGI